MNTRESQLHPFLRSLVIAAVVAFLLAPFVLIQLYKMAIRDIGAEPVPFPHPWRALGVGIAVSFGASFVCAFIAVLVFSRYSFRRN